MSHSIAEKAMPYSAPADKEPPHWSENILEDMDFGVFIVDRSLRFINGNSFVERLLTRHMDEIKGENIFTVIPFLDMYEWKDLYNDVLINGSIYKEKGISCKHIQNNGGQGSAFLEITIRPSRNELRKITGVVTIIRDVSKEFEYRREVQEWKDVIENFLEDAKIGIIVLDKDQNIIRYNKKAEENNKVPRERAISRKLGDTFPRNIMRPPLFDAHTKLIEKDIPYNINFDLYVPHVNDGKSTFRLRGAPLGKNRGYVMLVDREDSFYETKREIKEKTKDLMLSTKFLYHLIDASPNAVISIDNYDNIISFNKPAEDIYKLETSEVIGSKYGFLFSPEEKEKITDIVLSDASHWQGEVTGSRKDGSSFPAKVSISKVVDEGGNRIALLFLIEDITEKKELRRSLIQSKKMADLGEMIGGLAHQLNNPLVGVVNISDILTKRVEDDDPNLELIKTVGEAANECRKITKSLLTFSRKPRSVFSKLDIAQVLENSLVLIKKQSFFKEINIIKEYDVDLPVVMGDETRLRQVFLNVIVNAAQAMANGGDLRIEVRINNGSTLDGDNDFVEARFIDHGTGISKENLDKIFDPFFTTKEVDKGTGLGLSIAYAIVKEHNGKIDVASVEGQGTSFMIKLPVHSDLP